MQCLFVDIASYKGLLACVTDTEAQSSIELDERISDGELVQCVEEVLSKAKWTYQDLTHIAVAIGPGGFTSLRVAVSMANILSDQLQIPSTGVHLSDIHAARTDETDFYWLHSARKNEVFVRGFGSCEGQFSEPQHLQFDALLETFQKGAKWSGELIPEQLAQIRAREGVEITPKKTNSILPKFLSESTFSQQILIPWYGREY